MATRLTRIMTTTKYIFANRMMTLMLMILVLLINVAQSEFLDEYVTDHCGQWLQSRISGRLETSQSLTYENNMDCDVTISVTPGKKILLYVRRFELEEKQQGNCLDHVDIFDGVTSLFPSLLAEPLCGTIIQDFNLTTSSNHVTIRFVSDDTAVFRGFNIEYTEYSNAPCDAKEFTCSNNLCINSGNVCDDVTQCGDYSDEAKCTQADILDTERQSLNVALIVGCSVAGLILLIVLVVIIIKVYQCYKWRKFVKLAETWSTDDLYQYPVTDLYNKYDIGVKGRRDPQLTFEYNTFEEKPSTESHMESKPSSSEDIKQTVDI